MSFSSVCEQYDFNAFAATVFVVTAFVDSFGVTDNGVVIFSFCVFIVTFFFENLCKQSFFTYCKNENANKTLTQEPITC